MTDGEGGRIVGVDIGGTWIRAGIVDTDRLCVVGDTLTVPTALRRADMVAALHELVASLGWTGPVGIGVPGRVRDSVMTTNTNVDADWTEQPVTEWLPDHEVAVLNDADAVGLAEAASIEATSGTIVVLTFGTGIGSALIVDQVLVEGTELGVLRSDAGVFEDVCSARIVSAEGLSGRQWAVRARPYLEQLDEMFDPTRFVFTGGLMDRFDEFVPHLELPTDVSVGVHGVHAGVIGAALAVCRQRHRLAEGVR